VGRLLLVARLVLGNIKRRRLQSGLLLAMIVATTPTLTLALALHGLSNDPFARTRAATNGATPGQVTTGLAGAQVAPALITAILGIPAGLVLFGIAAGNPLNANPPVLWLIAVVPATLVAVAALTAIPARIGAQRPVAEVLRSE
jgi:putative ABC transport system permease protein